MAEEEAVYSVEQIDEPLYSILIAAGISQITHSEYEVLAVTDPDTTQAYLGAMQSDPETYTWESIIYTLREALNAPQDEEPPPPPEATDDAEDGGGELPVGGDDEGDPNGGEAEEAQGVTDPNPEDDDEQQQQQNASCDANDTEETPPPEGGTWVCSKCTFVNRSLDAAICAVCRASRNCETEGMGHIEHNAEGRLQLILRSDMLGPKSKYLKARFRVIKHNVESILVGKKDRIMEIDFFQREFRNCNPSGAVSFVLPSANLYRVERGPQNPTYLKLFFFKSAHAIDLIFPSCSERQRFIEVATLQRKNPVVWAPFFCRENAKECIVRIDGGMIETEGGKKETVNGSGTFIASRMPYEVLRLWAGTINLQFRGLPVLNEKVEEFMPCENDIYFIGLQEIPTSMRDGKQIQEYFSGYFGTNFYVLLNTSSDVNIFAGIEGRRGDKNPPGCILIIVRRSVLAKVGSIDFLEMNEPGQSGRKNKETSDVYGVFACLRVQETMIGALLGNMAPGLGTTEARNAKLQGLMGRIKSGDPLIDISVRFDYLFIMGSLGYHTLPFDELHTQIAGQLVCTDFQECTILADMCLPDRVLFWHRQRSARATILQYSTAPHLGMPNIHAVFDIYVLRPYCYALCPDVPPVRIAIANVKFECDTITSIAEPELRIAGEWYETGIVVVPLKVDGTRLVTQTLPPLIPICPAYEYLKAQSLCVSLLGQADGITKAKGALVASAVIPLRDMLTPDVPMTHTAFMMRIGTVIGLVELAVTYVTRK